MPPCSHSSLDRRDQRYAFADARRAVRRAGAGHAAGAGDGLTRWRPGPHCDQSRWYAPPALVYSFSFPHVKAERRAGGGEAGRAEASPAQPAPISIVPDAFQRHFSHLDRPAQGGEAGLQLFVVLACQAELIDFAAGKRPLGGGADIDHRAR